MKRPDRLKILKYVVFTLEIFILFLLGDTAHLLPAIGGARPALLVGAAVSIALSGVKELPAMSFGVLCGLLMDFSRGGPYGFHAMILAAVCYVSASLVQNLFQKNLLSALLMTILAVVLVFSLQWVFFYVLPGYGSAGYTLIRHYAPMAAYTLGTAVPIYFLTRGLAAVFRK